MTKKPDEAKKPTGEGDKGFPNADVAFVPPKETRRWPNLDALQEYESSFRDSEFSKISSKVPLLMLPVRLETKLDLTKDEEKLRIRIFPDQLHVKTNDEALSELESKAGQHFWAQAKDADRPLRKAALRQLIQTVGPRRAGHVVERTHPEFEPVEKLEPQKTLSRPELTVLPERWIAIGYTVNGFGFFAVSEPVKGRLSTALAGKEDAGPGDMVSKDGKWMIDYDTARASGMAMTIDLPASVVAVGEITTLVVFGVDSRLAPEEAKKEINVLFSNQERRVGVGFLPQGAPTNNTRGETTEWTHTNTDLEDMLDRLFAKKSADSETAVARLQEFIGIGDITALIRAPHATANEHSLRQAMNTVLFEAAIGKFVRDFLPPKGTSVDPTQLNVARNWFINHVTGGAPVATLRIGAQPYGILPVPALSRSTKQTMNRSVRGFIEKMVVQLREEWLRALDTVPLLDPNAIDRVSARERPTSSIPALLASQPHPARFFFRRHFTDDYGLVQSYNRYVAGLEKLNPDLHDIIKSRQPALAVAQDIDMQLAIWGGIAHRVVNSTNMPSRWRNRSLTQVNKVLEILGHIEQRQRPLKSLDPPYFIGTLGDTMSAYLENRPNKTLTEVTDRPLVTREPGEKKSSLAAETLSRLSKEIEEGKLENFAAPDLLTELIVSGTKSSPNPKNITWALQKLADTDDPELLDLLARETLGLVTHRLDAWHSSLAMEKIAAMRHSNDFDGGLVIGSFGWLTDLKFDEPRTSNGFIHAPSLSQAATAAVVRSGWLAHGGTKNTGPGAVNADSSRTKLALSILDGVRSGQPLGTLLGYRFERRLRESPDKLGGFIRDFRQLVITATNSDATEDEPIDGEHLLEFYRNNSLKTWLKDKPSMLTSELDRLTDVFDAVHDISLFEGTHAATQNKSAHATAVYEAVNQGTRLPPEFEAQRNPRSGVSVDHRAALLFPRLEGNLSDKRGWTAGLRDQLLPELERWLRVVLPTADQIGFTIAGESLSLSNLGLSACDALYLMDEDPAKVSAPMLTLAMSHFGLGEKERADALSESSQHAVSLEETQLLGIELRAIIDMATPLTASSLQQSGEMENIPEADDEAQKRLKDLRETLVRAIGDEDISGLARFGIAGGSRELRFERANRVAELTAAGDVDHDKAVATLLGRKLIRCPTFTMPTVKSVSFPKEFQKIDGWQWLEKIGTVRPIVDRLTMVRYLSETIGAEPMILHIGQDKRSNSSEGWAAIDLPPSGTGGRLSIVACSDQEVPNPGVSAVGLMIDQWSERIPAKDQLTGVAFHYDAPSSKPPQVMLLATPPPDTETWTMRDVAQVLFDTLQLAALRMVGPEDLTDFGAVLPTIYADLSDAFVQSGVKKEK